MKIFYIISLICWSGCLFLSIASKNWIAILPNSMLVVLYLEKLFLERKV